MDETNGWQRTSDPLDNAINVYIKVGVQSRLLALREYGTLKPVISPSELPYGPSSQRTV